MTEDQGKKPATATGTQKAAAPKKKKVPIERKFVKASTGDTVDKATQTTQVADVQKRVEPVGRNVTGLRIGSWVLWAVGIAAEVMAILFYNGTIYWGDKMVFTIGALVIDLVAVVIASQLWKKANHLNPPSDADKVKFNLQEQLGVIMSVIAFLPFVILAFTNKNADKQSKTITTAVAVVMLLIAGGSSIDFNPVSAEQQQAANEAAATYGDGTVYWTAYGQVYHLNPDCPHLLNSGTVFTGTVSEALDANRSRLCATCAAAQSVNVSDAPQLLIDDSGDTGKTPTTADAADAASTTSTTDAPTASSDSAAAASTQNTDTATTVQKAA